MRRPQHIHIEHMLMSQHLRSNISAEYQQNICKMDGLPILVVCLQVPVEARGSSP